MTGAAAAAAADVECRCRSCRACWRAWTETPQCMARRVTTTSTPVRPGREGNDCCWNWGGGAGQRLAGVGVELYLIALKVGRCFAPLILCPTYVLHSFKPRTPLLTLHPLSSHPLLLCMPQSTCRQRPAPREAQAGRLLWTGRSRYVLAPCDLCKRSQQQQGWGNVLGQGEAHSLCGSPVAADW